MLTSAPPSPHAPAPAGPGGTGRSGASRAIARNSGWQMLTFAGRLLGGLVASVLVARSYGPAGLGTMQLALTVAALAAGGVGLGLPNLLAREVARDPGRTREWLETGLFVVGVLSLPAAAVALAGWSLTGRGDLALAILLAVVSLPFDLGARLMFASFWAWERMELEALATWVQEASFVVVTALLLASGHGVAAVLTGYAGSRALGAAVAWLMASGRLAAPVAPRPHGRFLRQMLRLSIPFALDDLLSLSYIKIDALLLGAVKGATAVGLYQAGTNLVLTLNVLARTVNNALYPRLSRAWPQAGPDFRRLRDASLRLLAAMGVPLLVGAVMVAPRLMHAVYGDRFDAAVTCFSVLALVIPVRMLGHTLGTALTAADAQSSRTAAVAITTVANLGMNAVAIPLWSYTGAAFTTLVSEVGLLVGYGLLLRRRAGASALLPALVLPAAACVPMAAVAASTGRWPFVATVAAAAATYAVALVALLVHRLPAGLRSRPRALGAVLVGVGP
ncbi:MAG: Succinoglycan biosynthesis transport protein [Frankiales bacterium]|nr:Succinoglycan biosynthesis transport protein [Frankiales bacterium]